MELDIDLQRILNVGAKIYHTLSKKQGKVYSNNGIDIIVDYGKGNKYETYPIEVFSDLLISDTIVANSRVTLAPGDKEEFRIKPRDLQSDLVKMKPDLKVDVTIPIVHGLIERPKPAGPKLETGYINFVTQNFSDEPKKGYIKVEYRKSTEKVTLEVDSEMVEKLKELGLL